MYSLENSKKYQQINLLILLKVLKYASMETKYFTKMLTWKKMSVAYKEWTKK